MKRFRLSLAASMVFVALCAAVLAGFREPGPILASVVVAATAIVEAAAVVGALVLKGKEGAALTGCAIFCGGAFVWSFGYDHVPLPPPPSRLLLNAMEPRVFPTRSVTGTQLVGGPSTTSLSALGIGPVTRPPRVYDYLSYRQMGHALSAVLCGLAGGVLGAALSRRVT
jgi:hypothetical protein